MDVKTSNYGATGHARDVPQCSGLATGTTAHENIEDENIKDAKAKMSLPIINGCTESLDNEQVSDSNGNHSPANHLRDEVSCNHHSRENISHIRSSTDTTSGDMLSNRIRASTDHNVSQDGLSHNYGSTETRLCDTASHMDGPTNHELCDNVSHNRTRTDTSCSYVTHSEAESCNESDFSLYMSTETITLRSRRRSIGTSFSGLIAPRRRRYRKIGTRVTDSFADECVCCCIIL